MMGCKNHIQELLGQHFPVVLLIFLPSYVCSSPKLHNTTQNEGECLQIMCIVLFVFAVVMGNSFSNKVLNL